MAIFVAVIAFYLVMIAAFIAGYYRILEHKPIPSQHHSFISIVICLRNEEQNIANLFESIRALCYPTDLFEIVAVNDHSTDNTEIELDHQRQQHCNLRIINLLQESEGKKAALSAGVAAACGNIIAITDADCSLPPNWLENINNLTNAKADVVCGPVAYSPKTFFEHLAAVEFASLSAAGIGAAGVNRPIFCNAANMAFRKEVFTEANLHQEQTPSGDDVFLLHYAKQHHKNIRFISGLDCLVVTNADRNIKDFLNRRKRWGSKARHYTDTTTKQVAIVVSLTNVAILTCAATAILNHAYWRLAIALFASKMMLDYGLLSVHFRANGIKKWAKYFFLCAALYPIYITFTAIGSTTSKFTWKERRYNDPKASPLGHNHGES
jgi:Glycosyltransferases, probably involved in cell wall biogenesis